MIIYATKEAILHALEIVSGEYSGNIKFNREERVGTDRLGVPKWAITLRCVSSKAPGHRLSPKHFYAPMKQRRLISACWHVHGHFLDALPKGTKIISKKQVLYVPMPWNDWNVGSLRYPQYISELCECEV